METPNKVYVGWDEITRLVENICQQIVESGMQITSITGVERGGLIPAVMISHILQIPYVTNIKKNTLVVDDICDTGHTLKNIVGTKTATLHYKLTAEIQPTFFAKVVGPDWIVYPWERKDSEALVDHKK